MSSVILPMAGEELDSLLLSAFSVPDKSVKTPSSDFKSAWALLEEAIYRHELRWALRGMRTEGEKACELITPADFTLSAPADTAALAICRALYLLDNHLNTQRESHDSHNV